MLQVPSSRIFSDDRPQRTGQLFYEDLLKLPEATRLIWRRGRKQVRYVTFLGVIDPEQFEYEGPEGVPCRAPLWQAGATRYSTWGWNTECWLELA